MGALSKIDKEVLITSIVVFVVIILAGFIALRFMFGPVVNVQNSTGGAQTEKKSGT
jgi:flagellar basal body-associated protein FliL